LDTIKLKGYIVYGTFLEVGYAVVIRRGADLHEAPLLVWTSVFVEDMCLGGESHTHRE